jgi:hypothetical protein
VETFAVDLLRGLRERGHELLVVTSHAERELPDEDELCGIPVRRLPMREAVAARDVGSLGRVLRDATALKSAFGPELVHVHSVGPSLLLHLRSRVEETPWLLGLQTEALGSQRNGGSTLLGAALRTASWVVGCARFVTEQARRPAPEIGGRSSTIYNGVAHSALARTEAPEQPTVVYVGRLVSTERRGRAARGDRPAGAEDAGDPPAGRRRRVRAGVARAASAEPPAGEGGRFPRVR